ncbi:MAG: ABC transporter ATP-binding protein, partial [Metallibacterium sp.]
SDVMFIRDGRITLQTDMDSLGERYAEVMVAAEHAEAARALKPLSERNVFGKTVYLFDGVERQQLQALGEVRRPSLADIFVATMQGSYT